MKIIQNNTDFLKNSITDFFDLTDYKTILEFAETEIDLSDDVSAPADRLNFENYTYMKQPLSACTLQKGKRKEVVIAFPEQMGKSTIEFVSLLYATCYNTLQAIVLYPSQELAVQVSNVRFIPLFRKIKQFQDEINLPFAIRSDRLKLSNAVIYWQGGGTKVISKPAKVVICDEAASIQTPNNVNNLLELKKRTRAYNECLQVFVSTPTYKENAFWREFLSGSQGYFFLRCKGCGKLTMKSCDIHNLQFESVYNEDLRLYQVKPGTCRLICPVCGFEHTDADRREIISRGEYVHTFPELKETFPTFQAGVLASLLNVHSFEAIAAIQLTAGRTASLQDYISFDNSIRGLPYQERDYNKQDETALAEHAYKDGELKRDNIEAIYLIADTQDTFSVVGTFALTRQGNFYLMRVQRLRYLWLDDEERRIINQENARNGKPNEITVLDRLNQVYFDEIKPLMLFVDCRGHRTEEVKNFSRMQRNIILYAGTTLKYEAFKLSENIPKLFLVDAKKFQAQTIFELYFQKNKNTNYLYLNKSLTEKDIEEITAFQPDTTKRNGNLYENWDCKTRVHDCFDLVKMFFAALKISVKIYRSDKFRFNEAPILTKRVDEHPKKKTVIFAKKKRLNFGSY